MKIFNVSGYSSVLLSSVLLTSIALPTPRAIAIEADELTPGKTLGNIAVNASSAALTVPRISIPPQNFNYRFGSTLATPQGFNNTNTFRGCFKGEYGLLGTTADGPAPPPQYLSLPRVALAQPNTITLNLDEAAIARLKSVNVRMRVAFLGNSQGAKMFLGLRNLSTDEIVARFDIPITGGNCQIFNKDVVTGFQTPGSYRLEVLFINSMFRIDPANPNSPLTSEVAVAGFNATTITVVRK